jgi:CxxC motif-containing protein
LRMQNKYVCIICPNGCEVEAEVAGKGVKVKGNACRRGEDYVRKEIFSPERGLTTTVLVKNGLIPLASVKLSKPIPKNKVLEAMREIKKLEFQAPVKIGQILAENICGTTANLVATKTSGPKVPEGGKKHK